MKLASAGSVMTSRALGSTVTVGNTVVTSSGGFQHAQVIVYSVYTRTVWIGGFLSMILVFHCLPNYVEAEF